MHSDDNQDDEISQVESNKGIMFKYAYRYVLKGLFVVHNL